MKRSSFFLSCAIVLAGLSGAARVSAYPAVCNTTLCVKDFGTNEWLAVKGNNSWWINFGWNLKADLYLNNHPNMNACLYKRGAYGKVISRLLVPRYVSGGERNWHEIHNFASANNFITNFSTKKCTMP